MLQRMSSKVVSKIATLIIIEIILIIGSFGVLSYYQSQQSSLANTINIAGKNRYLTSNLLLQTEGYLDGTSNSLQLNAAINALQSNIMTLKQGGIISGIQLQPLPATFYDIWNTINTKWTNLKTSIFNNLINPSQGDRTKVEATTAINNSTLRQQFNQLASDLIIESDALVLKLAEQSNKNFSEPIILQFIFVPLNIGILVLILYLIKRILKPISVLTDAMSNVKEEGNLEISVNEKGKDELSILTRSFNLMIETIRNSVKKQEELTNKLAGINEEMKQASRLKDDFINIAAHELRNPVQPILGLAQLLHAELRGGDDQKMISREEQLKSLDIIIKNAKKLLLLEDNILDIARIENKSLKLNFEKFNLVELISTVIHDTADQIDNNKKITLQYNNNKKNGTIFQVNADKGRLSQVLSNLLSNSIKFTKNGIILVNLKGNENHNQAIVSVKDMGQGIDAQILPKLFTKFTTKSERGVGLGLFICKSIVEAHGGKIWAENNSRENGATFYLSLPAQIRRTDNYDHNTGHRSYISQCLS
jgi:signal transduction histidine kinase